MADDTVKQSPELEGSTYEVIRKRLIEQGEELRSRVGGLNERRQELFGGGGTVMQSTQRVRTEHNCVARDIVRVTDQRILLGYQVSFGLKTEMGVGDVFTKIAWDGERLEPTELEILNDARFAKDFREIFQYYKQARLLQLRRTETMVLMIFQTGDRPSDIKVLRWGLKGDHIEYIDNRGDRDHVFPPAHDFTWVRTTRDMHVLGAHPHVNVCDTVFVECIGGDLTVKVEDNTASGAGILAEPVDDASQGLDDAEILYADLDSAILLKIRPYREDAYRYIIFNKQTREAVRIDSIGFSCQQLPEAHGLIFPNGYYLADGSFKIFPIDAEGMEFIRQVRAPNGEDVAFIYHHRVEGRYQILQYNLITREVATPLICNGYSFFPDGRLVLFRADPEPQRMHAMQIWQTPFCSEEHAAAQEGGDGSFLATIGNRDLVRGISDALYVNRLIANQRPTMQVYEELLRAIAELFDGYHWLSHAEACGLHEQLAIIKGTADQVIDEFEKVEQLTAQAAQRLATLDKECRDLFRRVAISGLETIDAYVVELADLRAMRGRLDSAREVRYIDLDRLRALDAEVVARIEQLSGGAVGFLLQPEALAPYLAEIAELERAAEAIDSVAAAEPKAERVDELGRGLDLLMEIVNTLEIDDATQRTDILERISEVYGQLNRCRAVLAGRRKELGTREGRAEFGAQFKLLGQSVSNYLALCDTPEKTDELLAKLLVQVEELEARFVDFDEFVEQLTTRREEIYDSFQTRKQALLDERNRRAEQLVKSADRILAATRKRAMDFAELDGLNAYLASDPMVMKARAIVKELRALGDSVKADDVEARLKALREDAARTLRDRNELFEEGAIVKLGRHRFSANTQALELTVVPRGEGMAFHLTGTEYYEALDDEAFLATRPFWTQEVVSENQAVYRAEYLAWQVWRAAEAGVEGLSVQGLRSAAAEGVLLEELRRFASQRYEEGYERGLHDHDASLILRTLVELTEACGLLRHPASARALATSWWLGVEDEAVRAILQRRCRSIRRLKASFGPTAEEGALASECRQVLQDHAVALAWGGPVGLPGDAATYLVEQLGTEGDEFVVAGDAVTLHDRFLEQLQIRGERQGLLEDLAALAMQPAAALRLVRAWLDRYLAVEHTELAPFRDEVAIVLMSGGLGARQALHARSHATVEGLLGQHPRIAGKAMELDVAEFLERLGRFAVETVPAYRAYQDLRHRLVATERERLRLEEFKPRVLTSFVRNKLINEVYLPMVGDNLAKQMGTVGESKRTDLMGLLLLVSPPGYGKTTLMEYIASVLGLTFMKINGPAIGHGVGSLDPVEAPNATARQELEKLNLALEMGNNVMIYLDDIQHCHPEFLQKFISLCDGQRRIEGVWRGRTRTYDLRGKKVCVVMAGNPYTESGEKFQIPDMLANRADTYNLGDILGGTKDAFELSYLENCLTSNPVLSPISSRPQQDFYRLLRLAEGDESARADLEYPYSAVELDEIGAVLVRLRRVQRVLLAVNQMYIQSASMSDDDRTEPAFKLQGSYRNMAKLAEKIVAVMNEAELDQLIMDHYRSESQTLTSAAEANLLKFREMMGWQTPAEAERWQDIRRGFARRQELVGDGDDPMANALLQLIRLNERMGDIGSAIGAASQAAQAQAEREAASSGERAGLLAERIAPLLEALGEKMAAVAARPQSSGPTENRIEVINTLPKYYGKLYQHHIDVIERSLAPTLAAIGKHLGRSDDVRDKLHELVAHLRSLIKDQGQARTIDMDAGGEDLDQVEESD